MPNKGCGEKPKGVSRISKTALVTNTPPVSKTTKDRIPLTRTQ
jgi:hypothetical protein